VRPWEVAGRVAVLNRGPTVRWQSSQSRVVTKCPDGLPVAAVPLWHDEQGPVASEWSNVAGVHASVEWHVPQSAEVTICVGGFPAAVVPL
jgi:hypothetical protein